MISLLVDEDFDNTILRELLRRMPGIDVVRVQDVLLSGASDPEVLAWAADHDRVLITHDVSAMKSHAYSRVAADLKMPGLFAVPQLVPIGVAIDELILVVECSIEAEWEGQVRHLPL